METGNLYSNVIGTGFISCSSFRSQYWFMAVVPILINVISHLDFIRYT